MTSTAEFLWYVPNRVEAGHRGDSQVEGHNSLDTLTSHARALEDNGWQGALIGTGWGRPDTFTLATALLARTTTFQPLIAVRPDIGGRHISRRRRQPSIISVGGVFSSTSYRARTTSPRTVTARAIRPSATAAPRSSCG